MIDITKLKSLPTGGILFLTFALLSGVLFIFTFYNNLFFRLNIVQLILLSVVAIAPLVAINSLFVLMCLIDDKTNGQWTEQEIVKQFSGAVLFGSIISMGIVYTPIIIYATGPISFKIGLLIAGIAEFAILCSLYFSTKRNKTH